MKKNVFIPLMVLGVLTVFGEPMVTEDARCIAVKSLKTGVYFQWSETPENIYFSKKGDLFHAPVVEVDYGLAENAELQLLWPAGVFYEGDGNDKDASTWGDVTLYSKILIWGKINGPRWSFRTGVKLPNTSDESELGTDETDVFASLLFSKSIGPAELHLNGGVGILGDPHENRDQVDVLTYGMALSFDLGRKVKVFAEAEGWEGPKEWSERGTFRTGVYYSLKHFEIRAALFGGYRDYSPDRGVMLGAAKTFDLK